MADHSANEYLRCREEGRLLAAKVKHVLLQQFGRYVATELDALKSEEQVEEAKFGIMSVLYNVKKGERYGQWQNGQASASYGASSSATYGWPGAAAPGGGGGNYLQPLSPVLLGNDQQFNPGVAAHTQGVSILTHEAGSFTGL